MLPTQESIFDKTKQHGCLNRCPPNESGVDLFYGWTPIQFKTTIKPEQSDPYLPLQGLYFPQQGQAIANPICARPGLELTRGQLL